MSKFGIIGPAYTAKSNAIADEECINWIIETIETPGAQTKWSYIGRPGLSLFAAFPDSPYRGGLTTGERTFSFASDIFYELFVDGTFTARSPSLIVVFGEPVSMAWSSVQILIVAGGRAYCFTLADNSWLDITHLLAGTPKKVKYSDGYFIVMFRESNKFQMSDILDGTVWPGIQVNAVSVFAGNITSIEISHRELWVYGLNQSAIYGNTGSDEIFDVINGGSVESACGPTFSPCLLDNTICWVSQDQRGARQCWRANGYTPQRISTHAIETWLSRWPDADFANLTSYAYQDGGHLFWVLYVPNSDASLVYDVSNGLWVKWAEWHQEDGTWGPHRTWNHVYAFGKHLVGDWQTGNLYEMKLAEDTGGGVYAFVTDNGTLIRRLRRAPILCNEMEWIYMIQCVFDFATGLGPQPPLTDGDGNPRPPQAMVKISRDRGSTWGPQHTLDCGYAGQYTVRAILRRMGRARYPVIELAVSDPIPWYLVDGYLRAE
jgi:hypothetical protein